MSSKWDEKDGKHNDDDEKDYVNYDAKSAKDEKDSLSPPNIEITSIKIDGKCRPVTDELDLSISFEVDRSIFLLSINCSLLHALSLLSMLTHIPYDLRDVVCANWVIKFLVDTTENRLIRILGETSVEDYPEGESEMHFHVDSVNIDGIPRSTIANSGLLIATFMADGGEVACVNLVIDVHVDKPTGQLMREILNPLE